MRVCFKVCFDLPTDAKSGDAQAYVADAVMSMKGCLHPYDGKYSEGDPMSNLDPGTVTVVRFMKKKAGA